jgi:hypothetical protein
VRVPIRWRVIEPNRGERKFEAIDRAVAAIPDGVEILGILMSVPTWANGRDPERTEGWADSYPPTNLRDWERYVEDTVMHFKGRIRHWEIWNEQNGVDFYRPLPDPAGYAALLKTAYAAAKKADPKCVVVLGGLQMNGIVPNPWSPVKTPDFLEALYRAGAARHFDVCNIHPYVLPEEGADRMMSLIGDTLALMARFGDDRKPIWLTEVGSGATSPEGERKQAELLAKTYRLAAEEPRIQRVFWFLLRDTVKDVLGPESTMGLYGFDGRAKQSAAEFQQIARERR